MSAPKDGGPAFPQMIETGQVRALANGGFESVVELSGGMSLRDYFAAKALTGMLTAEFRVGRASLGQGPLHSEEAYSEWAYRQADAMLAERSK